MLLLSTVRWPSVARLAHGFAHAGCAVEALAPSGAAILASRYLVRAYSYRALRPQHSLQEAITRAGPDLAICCDERALSHLLVLYNGRAADRAVRELVERSLGNPAAVPRLISRNGFLAEARGEGIAVPDTLPVTTENELDAVLGALGFPVVLKSDGSWGGEGVAVVRNRAQAHAAFARLAFPPSPLRSMARALKRRDLNYLHEAFGAPRRMVSAQRFVPGAPAASAFAAWQGEIVAAIYYDVLIAEGTVGPPSVIRRTDCPQIADATRIVARRFGLSGIHGMDFIRDASGVAQLIEINPRATQGSTLAFGKGRDLPAGLAGRLRPDASARPAIADDVVAFFPREWKRDPLSSWLRSAHHDVPWDDPGVLYASLGRKVRRPRKLSRASAGRGRANSSLIHTSSQNPGTAG
ncbi:MAG: hypothetical protein ACREHF_02900 [Rhizomicrobium sp.]